MGAITSVVVQLVTSKLALIVARKNFLWLGSWEAAGAPAPAPKKSLLSKAGGKQARRGN